MPRIYFQDSNILGKKIKAITFPSGYIHIVLEDDTIIAFQEEEYTIYKEE